MLHEQDSIKSVNLLSKRHGRGVDPEYISIVPSNYHLKITDIEFGGAWSYHGVVTIDAEVLATTKRVILNSSQIDVVSCNSVFESHGLSINQQAASIDLDNDKSQACITFSKAIEKGTFRLTVHFKGRIDRSMCGFYRAKYEPHSDCNAPSVKVGNEHYLVTTHFEPCNARKAFPCFDEPHLKATFELELEIPIELVALSNMPERSVSQLDGSKQGLKVVTFEKTPVMSTYLLAWAVGDFEYVEAMTKREHKGRRVSVRVYTTRGMARYTHFALQDACDALDFFAETFGVDYPLPKCDHVVVHEFISGAMENWGMITYKPTKILFDPTTSDNRLMSKASYVIAHELAHQWFGNLVTMSGWNELWLNEGFATWAGYLAVDHMHPEWSIWGQFVDEAMEEAFAVDSLRCSHAIESPVNDEINAQQMFDSISYFKGSAVIRMLVNHLGRDVFLAGISSYLKCRSYGNATSDHLWQALSAVSDIDVKELMKGWIYQAGYPIVKISTASNQLQLRQRPFPRNLQGIDKSIWEVPLGMATSSPEDSRSTINSESCMLKRRTPLPKLNRDHTGFYRCEYPRDHLLSLTGSFANLSALDKVGIISDTRALVLAGQRPASELLDLLLSFKHETDCFIWSQIQKSVSILHSAVTDDKLICKALKSYISQLINPTRRFTNLTGDTDSYIKGELRKTLVQLAVKSGDQNVLDEVHLRFCRWKEGDTKAIDRNHLSSILNVAVSQGDELEYKAVKAEYLKNRTIDGREICIAAMGKTGVPAMARDFLDMTFSSDAHVELQNIHFVGNALSNGPCGMELWKYVRSNWDNVYKRLSANNTALEWFIENSLCGIDDAEVGRDVVQFLEGKKIPELDRPMQIVRDSIEQNVARKGQLRLEVTQWLSENMLPYSEDEGGESLTHRL